MLSTLALKHPNLYANSAFPFQLVHGPCTVLVFAKIKKSAGIVHHE